MQVLARYASRWVASYDGSGTNFALFIEGPNASDLCLSTRTA